MINPHPWTAWLGTLDWLEILWTASALVALVVALDNVRDAYRDQRVVVGRKLNGLLRLETAGAIGDEYIRVAKALCMLVAGVIVLRLPNAPYAWQWDAATAIRAFLVAVNLLITAGAVWARYGRIRQRRYREARRPPQPPPGGWRRRATDPKPDEPSPPTATR